MGFNNPDVSWKELERTLSDRARSSRVHVVSALVDGDTPSTKSAAAALASVSGAKPVLVVVERSDAAGVAVVGMDARLRTHPHLALRPSETPLVARRPVAV